MQELAWQLGLAWLKVQEGMERDTVAELAHKIVVGAFLVAEKGTGRKGRGLGVDAGHNLGWDAAVAVDVAVAVVRLCCRRGSSRQKWRT